jgi:uncharacterized membrane protein YesL
MLDRFFSPDNPMSRFLSRVWDLIVLNALFLVTSIPIFTIGASLTAMSDLTLRMVRGEDEYLVRPYFRSFRKNFKRATLLWLPILAVALFLGADLYIIYNVIDKTWRFFQYPVWLLVFFLACVFFFAFPITARYEESYLGTVRNALLLGLGNLPVTIFFTVILAVIVDVGLHNPTAGVVFFSLFLFIGCAALSCLFSIFVNRIFDKAGH